MNELDSYEKPKSNIQVLSHQVEDFNNSSEILEKPMAIKGVN